MLAPERRARHSANEPASPAATPAAPPAAAGSADARAAAVLSKAVIRAADRLAIARGTLGAILGVSPATISRLYAGEYRLDARRKEWEHAVLLVRVFRSLDAIVGNEETARRWLTSENTGLSARPIDLLVKSEGLVRVAHYLDATRGIV